MPKKHVQGHQFDTCVIKMNKQFQNNSRLNIEYVLLFSRWNTQGCGIRIAYLGIRLCASVTLLTGGEWEPSLEHLSSKGGRVQVPEDWSEEPS